LTVGYDAPVLTGVDLDLPPGAHVALVGPSGAGKTTLLMTLAGLMLPHGGAVTGPEGSMRSLAELQAMTTFIAADAHVFTTTVRENLRLAAPDADDTALDGALTAAGLPGWRAVLPHGLDTMVSNGSGPGHVLSGGELRRLLIARAVLTDTPIVLLDEPAEHLDPRTADALILDALDPTGMFAGRTVIIATHRLTPLAAADEVVVVDAGRVTARGHHGRLLVQLPHYRRSWTTEESPLVSQSTHN
jgi:ATP-binding cassette subfamily C protein CydC